MNKWFNSDGYDSSGYIQIQKRQEYVAKEINHLRLRNLCYELQVIQDMINQIPNSDSRQNYQKNFLEFIAKL